MPELDETKRTEELRRRADDAKRVALEAELQRIDHDTDRRGRELFQAHQVEMEREHSRILLDAQERRRKEEKLLKVQEQEVLRDLDAARQKRMEARRAAEAERKRQDELARKKAEEEKRRLKKEESARRKADAERRRQEEVRRLKEEKKKRNQEAEERRRELVQRLKEEEIQKREEREERITELLENAETFYAEGESKHAAAEVAKALAIDPDRPEAKELARRIKEGKDQQEVRLGEVKKTPKAKNALAKSIKVASVVKRRFPVRFLIPAAAAVLVIAVVVLNQWKKEPFRPSLNFAVLPWTSPANSPEDNMVGTALAAEVAERFAMLKPMTVMGFRSAYGLSRYASDPSQAVYGLGYPFALEGVVSQSGQLLTINIRLVDSLGGVAWSHGYQRDMASIASLPSEIALEVISSLQHDPDLDTRAVTAHSNSINAAAYIAYLHGVDMLYRSTPESADNALVFFQDAIRGEGSFPEAQAAAASVMMLQYERGWDTSDTLLQKAERYARSGISANNSIGDGYCALGNVYAQSRKYNSALKEFESALSRQPNKAAVYVSKAKVLLKMGKHTEALDALARAFTLDPRNPEVLQTLALAYQLKGKPRQGIWYHETALQFVQDSTSYILGPYADAIELDPDLSLSRGGRVTSASEHLLAQNPDDYVTGYRFSRLQQVTGNFGEAALRLGKIENTLRTTLQHDPKNVSALTYLALTLTRSGKFPEATAIAQRVSEIGKNNPEVRYRIAQMYSLQMYSQKDKKIDEAKKSEAVKALRSALALSYRLDELGNADFYNMYEQPEFLSIIQEPIQ